VTRDLTQDPVLREQRHDHELCEQPRLHPLHHAPGQLPVSGSPNSIATSAEAGALPSRLMRADEQLRQLEQSRAESLGSLDEVRVVQLANVASPAAMARSFGAKVDPWLTECSSESNTPL